MGMLRIVLSICDTLFSIYSTEREIGVNRLGAKRTWGEHYSLWGPDIVMYKFGAPFC